MNIYTTKETITEAVHCFHLDREGYPELVPLGITPLDRELGGLGPGACGILAAATGVGKSSTMLSAMLNSKVKVGSISLEDGPDVVGARLLSALTGIDSLRIRRKDLSKPELQMIAKVAKDPALDQLHFTYPIAGTIEDVMDSVAALRRAGCRMIWVDYIQEIRGHGKGDRRNEVSEAMTLIHRAVASPHDRHGALITVDDDQPAKPAACMVISQFRRLGEQDKVPQIYHLKESGDLENKARVIVLAHRVSDPDSKDRVRFRLAKSTYGGEHIRFDMTRDSSGTLREADLHLIEEDW